MWGKKTDEWWENSKIMKIFSFLPKDKQEIQRKEEDDSGSTALII